MTKQTGETRCPKCGGNTDNKNPGSITQWVAICACALQTAASADVDAGIEICSTCKKRVNTGRAGSLTQWIFRSDLCSCNNPLVRSAATDKVAIPEETISELKEKELEIDSEKFPTERYGPLKILGVGAGGTVYLCKDKLLKKVVAVKVLNSLSAEQLIAFQGEARAASKLNHQNVVKILDFGVTPSGAPYMVMEKVDGKDLASILKEVGNISTTAALYIFSRVSEGLAEAHRNRIFHRDIKSSNILVGEFSSRSPEVKIIDFGVASFSPSESTQTMQGKTLVGTPSYMSPDQAAGKPFDARCEVYSVGCALFESLTGRTPFQGETALEIINKQVTKEAPQLSDLAPDIEFPEDLERVLAKCLEKDPERRFQTMDELNSALNAVACGQTLEWDGEPSAKVEGARPEKLQKKKLPLVLALAVASVAIIAPVYFMSMEKPGELEQREKTVKPVEELSALPSGDTPHFEKLRYQGVPFLVTTGELVDSDFENIPAKTDGLYILRENNSCEGLARLADHPLKILKINNTHITDRAYEAISNIRSLKKLALTELGVTAEHLEKLSKLPNLESIDLSSSNLSDGAIAMLSKFPNLKEVDLTAAQTVARDELTELSKLPRLKSLNLSYIPLDSLDITTLKRLTGLESLNLSCTKIDDEAIATIAAMAPRAVLLDGTQITPEGLMKLADAGTVGSISARRCVRISKQSTEQLKARHPELAIIQ